MKDIWPKKYFFSYKIHIFQNFFEYNPKNNSFVLKISSKKNN
jgi:hypothetical protein